MTDRGVTEVDPDDELAPVPVAAVPAGPHERWIQVACAVGVLLQTIRYYAHLPFLGYLLKRPLRYVLVYPSTVAFVEAGAYARVGRDPAWAVVLAGVASFFVVDPLRWLAGRRYGDRVATLIAGNNVAIVRRVEKFSAKWGTWGLILAWYTPIPIVLIQLAAGTAGMSFKKFVIADLAGILLWVLTVAGLGYGIGQPAVNAVKRISHYSLQVTIVAVIIAVVFGAMRARKAQRG